MDLMIDSRVIFHRTKERIRDFGEVFTPEKYVEQMLLVLERDNKSIWDDESIGFFEPCCGHGNIVLSILKKRLSAFYLKSLQNNNVKYATFYAIANSINTLWAIDIDEQNVIESRTRVFEEIISFAKERLNIKNNKKLIHTDLEFFTHLIAAVYWQISENEMFSSLNINDNFLNTAQTKTCSNWLINHNYKKLNFENNWITYFKYKREKGITPKLFTQANKFLKDIITKPLINSNNFQFAISLYNKRRNLENFKSECGC